MSSAQSGRTSFKIDEESFKDIYNQYWEKVFTVCYHNLGDTERAKGMVQEIFKSLWERKDELEITQSVEGYLIRSAKFKVFEFIRNKKIREQHLEQIVYNRIESVNFTENEVMLQNLKDRLTNLIDSLPTQCRRVFKMSREEGLSNKEIASDLLISERAVEYHITKAISSLKSRLTEYSF
ncbi:RNA polymerase sigma-70 factor [Dyadobacter psychrotolerans]|uniref:RNA polymerase sigma-70 factor n=1 Tax=Dyadobacter psychrotolerans TaxID=2541721 RepID=A0A4R5DDZ9_9BACT|nr:RNA polymerase sigma-70 factor [Dyadobacter psychrotolerans]TDE11297.1 RNA polymerase sigma-70 factor [Dyadobacter psychrotolerans]